MMCSIDGCAKEAANRAMCWMHHSRWKRHGDATHERAPSSNAASVKRRQLRATQPRVRASVGVARCGLCGTAFEQSRDRMRFCSLKCRLLSKAPVTWPPIRTRNAKACAVSYGRCAQCNRLFASQKPRTTCSESCARKASYSYVPVEPHDTECRQCGAIFVGKWRDICVGCAESNARAAKHAARAGRKERERGRPFKRADIFERDGWRCHLCGKACDRDAKVPDSKAATIDHIIPIAHGGLDDPINVATAHFICNSRRGTRGVAQLRLVA